MMAATRKRRYLLCVRNEGCEDLELRKLYEQLFDERAEADGWVRVIDESGEDYLYLAKRFMALDLPPSALRALSNGVRRVGGAARS